VHVVGAVGIVYRFHDIFSSLLERLTKPRWQLRKV
jgi:hypothetical protein